MDIDRRLQEAVQSFWTGRAAQAGKQKEAGKVDAGIRGAVTGGQHMGALETLVVDILIAAGLTDVMGSGVRIGAASNCGRTRLFKMAVKHFLQL